MGNNEHMTDGESTLLVTTEEVVMIAQCNPGVCGFPFGSVVDYQGGVPE